MIAVALAVVGLGAVLALWDGVRRALQAQVRQAELRVEALRRVELDELRAEIKRVEDMARKAEREVDTLDKNLALGRKR